MSKDSSQGESRTSSKSSKTDTKSSSPVPSPGSWNNVDRGRSRVRRPSNPYSENSLRRRGYHALQSSFGKTFHVEKRWKLVREMGSGAYGYVISAADDISGETVAIKLVTRVFEKVQLAKRALREITLLRHFANHENITGLIDVDAVSPDFNEIYIFMEPMEADLHQIIKSGQTLTNEHVQYFLYQILRGMKYVHSASVIHRDLKPGNLLVNSDCELKICDFGLSRGFTQISGENATHLTEYVATRWYRAPEIMLAFNRYSTAIDVWSIGCILAELLLGKPLFKGKDYVDQLNKILDVLGTPAEAVIKRIGSEKAQTYVRSLPIKKPVPFQKLLPLADAQAIDLLTKMLSFDPSIRISVPDALLHPWLSSYHDVNDEPECVQPFEKWHEIEQLETLEQFREALWKEIEDYRKEVRGMNVEVDYLGNSTGESRKRSVERMEGREGPDSPEIEPPTVGATQKQATESEVKPPVIKEPLDGAANLGAPPLPVPEIARSITPTDPVVTYARRSSILGPSRQNSTFTSPMVPQQHLPSYAEGPMHAEPGSVVSGGGVIFPSHGRTESYILPARSRTTSTPSGEVSRKLLRTLSTVSIHESIEGLPGGLAGVAEIREYIVGKQTTEADAPPSEIPQEFGIDEGDEDEDGRDDSERDKSERGKFRIG